MWNRKKELKKLQHHSGYKEFLSHLTSHLYRTDMEEDEEFNNLYLEEDESCSADGFDACRLEARKDYNNAHGLYIPTFSLRLMEYLLDGFAVVTSIKDHPISPLLLEEMTLYRLIPQRFVPSYVRFCKSHPQMQERVYYDEKAALLTLTHGMNRGAIDALFTTPGFQYSTWMMQSAYGSALLETPPLEYPQAQLLSEREDYFFSMNGSGRIIHIYLQNDHFSEKELLSKLRTFCLANGKGLHVLWPEDPALR